MYSNDDLIRRLENSEDTVNELVRLGKKDESVVDALASAFIGMNLSIGRQRIVKVLGEIKSKRAIPVLEKALTDNDLFVRSETAEALGKIGGKNAHRVLKGASKSSDLVVKNSAITALGNLKKPRRRLLQPPKMDARKLHRMGLPANARHPNALAKTARIRKARTR